MNKFQTTAAVFAICVSSTFANAQCVNGVCKMPPLNSSPGYSSLYRGLPTTLDERRPATQNSGRFDDRFGDVAACLECGCNGQYCDCGPNCPPHYQSGVLGGMNGGINGPLSGQSLYRDEQSLMGRNAYPGTLRAPNPVSNQVPNRYQSTSYTTSVSWMTNYEHGLAASRRSGRPMLVKISADWCDFCQQMKRQTYTDQGVVRTISNGFVPVTLDGDVDRKLIQQLGVRSLPAVVVIAPDLRIIDRIEGFKTAQQLTTSLLRHRPRAQLDVEGQVATR
jgi:thiol-disulfide isomerase/thioredoxin